MRSRPIEEMEVGVHESPSNHSEQADELLVSQTDTSTPSEATLPPSSGLESIFSSLDDGADLPYRVFGSLAQRLKITSGVLFSSMQWGKSLYPATTVGINHQSIADVVLSRDTVASDFRAPSGATIIADSRLIELHPALHAMEEQAVFASITVSESLWGGVLVLGSEYSIGTEFQSSLSEVAGLYGATLENSPLFPLLLNSPQPIAVGSSEELVQWSESVSNPQILLIDFQPCMTYLYSDISGIVETELVALIQRFIQISFVDICTPLWTSDRVVLLIIPDRGEDFANLLLCHIGDSLVRALNAPDLPRPSLVFSKPLPDRGEITSLLSEYL